MPFCFIILFFCSHTNDLITRVGLLFKFGKMSGTLSPSLSKSVPTCSCSSCGHPTSSGIPCPRPCLFSPGFQTGPLHRSSRCLLWCRWTHPCWATQICHSKICEIETRMRTWRHLQYTSNYIQFIYDLWPLTADLTNPQIYHSKICEIEARSRKCQHRQYTSNYIQFMTLWPLTGDLMNPISIQLNMLTQTWTRSWWNCL